MMKWELIESGDNGNWFKLSIEGGYILRHVYSSAQYFHAESMVFIPNSPELKVEKEKKPSKITKK